MPITINGTGTVAGITAGGLPDGCVATSDIVNDAVTTAKILNANVTPAKLSQPLTLATAQNTTSGTSIDFTGIPSWAKRIILQLNGVSTNGTSLITIRLGTSAGIVASGYSQASWYSTSYYSLDTTGFAVTVLPSLSTAANTINGSVCLLSALANVWSCTGSTFHTASGGFPVFHSGNVTLSGALDRIRLTTVNGTDTFDAGSVNIMYEG